MSTAVRTLNLALSGYVILNSGPGEEMEYQDHNNVGFFQLFGEFGCWQ